MPKVKPITPREAAQQKQNDIPDQVIECWNKLIVKHFKQYSGSATSGYAKFRQVEAVSMIAEVMNVKSEEVYENHWLDIEPLYKKSGWEVVYDKPAYNENYHATFEFSTKRT